MRSVAGAPTLALALALVLAACGGDEAPAEPTQGAEPDLAAEPGDSTVLVGAFTIELVDGDAAVGMPALSSMRGVVRDGPVYDRIHWVPADEAGGCMLETPETPFCDPDCGADSACVADGECRVLPVAVDVGTVTVSGVRTDSGDTSFQLTKIGPAYQPDAAVDLSYPPADEGAEVRLEASGGDHAPFEAVTTGIAPLEVQVEGVLPAEREQPLQVSWTPPGPDSDSSMSALVDVSHHGGAKGRIVCEVDDATGELSIDAALVTALLELGTAGFPTIRLTRRAQRRATAAGTDAEVGEVDFAIEHSREIPLEIPGLVSCGEATDCPDGQSCLPTRKCG